MKTGVALVSREAAPARRRWWRRPWSFIKDVAARWRKDDVPRMAAALSYFTAFSLAPLLIFAISIAGMVFGEQAAQGEVIDQISGLIGHQSASAIQGMMQAVINRPAAGTFSTVVGIVTLLMGATGVFSELTDGLNDVWDARTSLPGGVTEVIKRRVKLFGMVLGIGFLLLVSLLVSAAVAAFTKSVRGYLPFSHLVPRLADFLVSFGVISLLFAALYKFLPNARIAWRDVWIGASATSLLFTLGKVALGFYLGTGRIASYYGAASSILVILLWVYYSGLILYLGAEFTRSWAEHFGSRSRGGDVFEKKGAFPSENH